MFHVNIAYKVFSNVFVFRDYMPTVEEYFETAVEQADPEGGIEEQYK